MEISKIKIPGNNTPIDIKDAVARELIADINEALYDDPTSGHDYVEIGGVKWATMNIGAESVTDIGLYFQWGDAQGYTAAQVGSGEGQKYFGWADYKYGNGTSSQSASDMTKYNSTDGKTVLDASDDAVTTAWGGSWRMPTTAEFAALGAAIDYIDADGNTITGTDKRTTLSGVTGLYVADKIDHSKRLFFPAAGYCESGSVIDVGSDGYYWPSSVYGNNLHGAYLFDFYSSGVNWQDSSNRCSGFTLRGVLDVPSTPQPKVVLKTEVGVANGVASLDNSGKVPYSQLPDIETEYGIQWTGANTTPTRIGSPNLHRTLPIQSLMRRCIKTANGFKYISDSDYTKYEDGTTVNYLTDGDLFVHIPKYWYRAYDETIDGTSYHKLMLYTKETAGAKESKEVYIGAVEASSDDASNSTNPALYSIIKANIVYNQDGSVSAANLTYPEDAINYRGGNQRGSSSWDEIAEKCCLGRPVTNLTRAAFRQRASRRGTGYSQQYWSAYMAMVRLYVVEYCNFNTQASYNSAKTSDGYMQGGLGAGISTDSSWSTHNDYNPFVPCGVTLRLGNKTGIVSFASGSAYTGSVPSYRGVENPFAHIWKWTDGINIYTANGVTDVYVTDDITKFADDTATDYEKHVTFTRSFTEGYISKWNWDDNGEFIPTAVGGSDGSYLYDYSWWNNTNIEWRVLFSGGDAYCGAACGWFCFDADDGSGRAYPHIGGRLYYTPNN